MSNFQLITFKEGFKTEKPHFFILNKGNNSGKPMNEPCPNCFVCKCENMEDKELLYWLCFGLWKSRSFHYFLKGSVIPYITIGELKKHLRESFGKIEHQMERFTKSVQALQIIDKEETRIKSNLKVLDTARKAIFYKLMNSKNLAS